MPNLLGSNPNQVGTNADHGSMAFQDENAVNIGGGLVQADLTGNSFNQNTDISTAQPTLRLDFDKMFALDPRITFGRSGSPASYYDGKTFAMAEQNLALWSQDYTNAAWVKSNVTNVANAFPAPDGTLTASMLTATANNGTMLQTFTETANPYTFSLYIYRVTGSGNIDIAVDGTTYATQSTTGAWTRFNIVTTPSAGSKTAGIRLATSGDQVYVWGAQLEQRSAVSAYTPTTSAAITNYIPQLMTAAANQARFDFDPITGECKGLLVEEQRANLFYYASDLTNATYWTKSAASILGNAIVAPDGTLTGNKLIEDTTSAQHSVRQSFTADGSTSNVVSYFLKAGQHTQALVTNGTATVTVDLSAGTIGTPTAGTASIAPAGNGWYRVSLAYVNSAGSKNSFVYLRAGDSYIGNGWAGLYIWGAQLEAGSFATSYIPTTTGQVTRTADAPSMTGLGFSQWWNDGIGTFVFEYDRIGGSASTLAIIQNSAQSSYMNIQALGNLTVQAGNTAGLQVTTPAGTLNTLAKVAIAMATNDMACYMNGVAGSTDSVGLMASGLDRMSFGYELGGSKQLNGHIRRLAYFPKRLTNAELVEMTA